MTAYRRADIASRIDHTLLTPEATEADVIAHCREAAELGVGVVCVSPSLVRLARDIAEPYTSVATVCGFPSGKHLAEIKAAEAALALADGATEIDMVIDLAAALAGRYDAVEAEIRAVRRSASLATLKVILETAALGDSDVIAACCHAAQRAGADFVKTSTGFHPAGGARVEHVEVMHRAVGGRLGIKASGGIRDANAAAALLDAGATRLGLSSSRSVLAGFPVA